MLPLKKRPYRGDDFSVAKRLRAVEAQTRRNRPEMKHKYIVFAGPGTVATNTSTIYNITDIGQDSTETGREGNRVKIYRVEVRGDCSAGLSCYMLKSINGHVPVHGDFTGGTVASSDFIADAKDGTELIELFFKRPIPGITGVPSPVRTIRKFRGLDTCYPSASTTPSRNGLYFVIRNTSGSTLSFDMVAKIWYTE